jgi:tetratricopeptide (TPR) repeat protein
VDGKLLSNGMKRYSIFLFTVLLSFLASSQSQQEELIERIDSLNSFAFENRTIKLEKSLRAAKEAKSLSNDTYNKGYYEALLTLAFHLQYVSEFDSAVALLNQSKRFFRETDPVKYGMTLGYLGIIRYDHKADVESALQYFNEAETLFKQYNENKYLAWVYGERGQVLRKAKRYNEALEEYLKAYEVRKESQPH